MRFAPLVERWTRRLEVPVLRRPHVCWRIVSAFAAADCIWGRRKLLAAMALSRRPAPPQATQARRLPGRGGPIDRLHDVPGPQACPSVATLPGRWPKPIADLFLKCSTQCSSRGSAMKRSRPTSVRGLAAQAKPRRGKHHPHTSEWEWREVFEATPAMYFLSAGVGSGPNVSA